tara:strand:+ start:2115 stop:2639 length:525 start_codon:yes stop_codon:yes gene_type:complete
MQIKKTKFTGLKIISNKIYKDYRGYFKEDFKSIFFKGSKFIFSCTSKSKKNVLRGLHMQTKNKQGKFVSVLKGSILDVVVDLRKNSKTFGKHYKIKLSDKNGKSIFIPPGFAHGFLALKKENIVHYYNTNYRSAKHEIGIAWNDSSLKIKWPTKKPIISKKDRKNLTLREFLNK